MCPNSAPRPCRAQAQTQRYNRVCESLSWVSSRKKVRETCQTQLTFSDSLSALPSYIVSDTFSSHDLELTRAVAGLDVLVAVAHDRHVTAGAVADLDLVVAVAGYRHGIVVAFADLDLAGKGDATSY